MGIIFNIVFFLLYFLKHQNSIDVDIKGSIVFILFSWFIYPILWISSKE